MKEEMGFTLIELLMTSVIIILLGVMIAPKWSEVLHSWDLEMEVRKMTAEVRKLQQLSVKEGLQYGIKVSGSGSSCYNYGTFAAGPSFNMIDQICLNNNAVVYSVSAEGGISNSPPWEMHFDYMGAPYIIDNGGISQAGNVGLIIHDAKGNSGTVRISGISGRIDSQI